MNLREHNGSTERMRLFNVFQMQAAVRRTEPSESLGALQPCSHVTRTPGPRCHFQNPHSNHGMRLKWVTWSGVFVKFHHHGVSQVSWLTNNAMHCFYRTVESCILIKSIITKLTDESVYRREAWEEIAHLISTCYEYHNTNSIIFSFHIFFFRKW